MENQTFDIQLMSQQSEIPVFLIKEALGIPLIGECEATTFAEAMRSYKDINDTESELGQICLQKALSFVTSLAEVEAIEDPYMDKSELGQLVIRKKIELYSEEISKADTFETAYGLFRSVMIDYDVCDELENMMVTRCLELVKTITAIENLDENYPGNSAKEMNRVSLKRLEFITTTEEAEKFHDATIEGSDVQKLVAQKWLTLITTIQEASDFFDLQPVGSEEEKMALKKWDDLCMKALPSVTNFDEALELYESTPEYGNADKPIFIQCLEFVTVEEHADKLDGFIPGNFEYEQLLIKKRAELFYGWKED